MSNVSNERWEGDLEADQLDDLAAREQREDERPTVIDWRSERGDIPGPGPVESPTESAHAAGVSNEQWAGDLEADVLDQEAAEEDDEERTGDPGDLM